MRRIAMLNREMNMKELRIIRGSVNIAMKQYSGWLSFLCSVCHCFFSCCMRKQSHWQTVAVVTVTRRKENERNKERKTFSFLILTTRCMVAAEGLALRCGAECYPKQKHGLRVWNP